VTNGIAVIFILNHVFPFVNTPILKNLQFHEYFRWNKSVDKQHQYMLLYLYEWQYSNWGGGQNE